MIPKAEQADRLERDFYIHLTEDSNPTAVLCAKKKKDPSKVARLPKKVEVVMDGENVVGFATDDMRFIVTKITKHA